VIEYRLLTKPEIPNAVALWVKVFGVEEAFFTSLLAAEEPDDFSVGAFENGRQVSSVHVFLRSFRDRNGEPLKVGGIGSVSTLPSARKQGHSGRLLTLAIEGMTERGCIYSYLATGVHDHYARYGWRTVSGAVLCGEPRKDSQSFAVERVAVSDQTLSQMERLYRESTGSTPMANVRSTKFWDTSVRYRVSGSEDRIYMSTQNDVRTAYLVERESEAGLELIEAAGEPGAVSGLIKNRLSLAAERGVKTIQSFLPVDSVAGSAVKAGCERVWSAEERTWMVRPIENRITLPDLVAIHADPRGRRSQLDNF
jgi:predicted N-acetyltransferase YhbS